jgi:dynein heavy chain
MISRKSTVVLKRPTPTLKAN